MLQLILRINLYVVLTLLAAAIPSAGIQTHSTEENDKITPKVFIISMVGPPSPLT